MGLAFAPGLVDSTDLRAAVELGRHAILVDSSHFLLICCVNPSGNIMNAYVGIVGFVLMTTACSSATTRPANGPKTSPFYVTDYEVALNGKSYWSVGCEFSEPATTKMALDSIDAHAGEIAKCATKPTKVRISWTAAAGTVNDVEVRSVSADAPINPANTSHEMTDTDKCIIAVLKSTSSSVSGRCKAILDIAPDK
jgi:hypothetical protein